MQYGDDDDIYKENPDPGAGPGIIEFQFLDSTRLRVITSAMGFFNYDIIYDEKTGEVKKGNSVIMTILEINGQSVVIKDRVDAYSIDPDKVDMSKFGEGAYVKLLCAPV